MNDQDLLRDLDERAATAAAGLRSGAAAHPVPAFEDRLPSPAPRLGRNDRSVARRIGVGIAAALLVAGGLGWLATSTGKDDPHVSKTLTTGDPRPYVATDLPDGFALAGVADLPGGPPSERPAPLLVFGPSEDEPGLGVTVQQRFALDGVSAGTPIDVGGRGGFAYDGVGLGRRALVVPVGDRSLLVTSPRLDRGDLARIAAATEVANGRAKVDITTLPDGWRLLGEEPNAIGVASPLGVMRGGGAGSAATYFDAAGDTESPATRSISVWSSGGDKVSVHVQELFTDTSEEIPVRGHDAVLGRYGPQAGSSGAAALVLAWEESPGEVIRVQTVGVDRADLLALAEGLRPARPGEWADLVERTKLDEFSPARGGVEYEDLASGRFADGTAWRLRISSGADGEPVTTHLTVAMDGDQLSGGSSSASSGLPAADEPFGTFETLDQGGRHFANGLLGTTVARIELRRADDSVIGQVDVVGDATRRAWVAEITEDPTIVVALGDDGAELARRTVKDLNGDFAVGTHETATPVPGD